MDRYEIVGEEWSPDPVERRRRALAQLVDKPLTVILVALAFGLAARGPGSLVEGYEPSGWFVLGLWLALSVAARLLIVGAVRRMRAAWNIPAPRRRDETE
jgi:hypothetical protein